jgi:hypothetical protein
VHAACDARFNQQRAARQARPTPPWGCRAGSRGREHCEQKLQMMGVCRRRKCDVANTATIISGTTTLACAEHTIVGIIVHLHHLCMYACAAHEWAWLSIGGVYVFVQGRAGMGQTSCGDGMGWG